MFCQEQRFIAVEADSRQAVSIGVLIFGNRYANDYTTAKLARCRNMTLGVF